MKSFLIGSICLFLAKQVALLQIGKYTITNDRVISPEWDITIESIKGPGFSWTPSEKYPTPPKLSPEINQYVWCPTCLLYKRYGPPTWSAEDQINSQNDVAIPGTPQENLNQQTFYPPSFPQPQQSFYSPRFQNSFYPPTPQNQQPFYPGFLPQSPMYNMPFYRPQPPYPASLPFSQINPVSPVPVNTEGAVNRFAGLTTSPEQIDVLIKKLIAMLDFIENIDLTELRSTLENAVSEYLEPAMKMASEVLVRMYTNPTPLLEYSLGKDVTKGLESIITTVAKVLEEGRKQNLSFAKLIPKIPENQEHHSTQQSGSETIINEDTLDKETEKIEARHVEHEHQDDVQPQVRSTNIDEMQHSEHQQQEMENNVENKEEEMNEQNAHQSNQDVDEPIVAENNVAQEETHDPNFTYNTGKIEKHDTTFTLFPEHGFKNVTVDIQPQSITKVTFFTGVAGKNIIKEVFVNNVKTGRYVNGQRKKIGQHEHKPVHECQHGFYEDSIDFAKGYHKIPNSEIMNVLLSDVTQDTIHIKTLNQETGDIIEEIYSRHDKKLIKKTINNEVQCETK